MNGGLQIKPPQDMYTMPDQRISHFISDEQVGLIENMGQSKIFSVGLVLAGSAIGFLKDFFIALGVLFDGKSLDASLSIPAFLFCGSLIGAAALIFAHQQKEEPVKKLCEELRARQRNEFSRS